MFKKIASITGAIALVLGGITISAAPANATATSCTAPAVATTVNGISGCLASFGPANTGNATNGSFTVPASVTAVTVSVTGGSGRDRNSTILGGKAAQITADLAVTPGDILDVTSPGSAGGAGAGSYCGPGGAQYVSFAGYGGAYAKVALRSNPTGVLAVAAGGGGAGCGDTLGAAGGNGGNGGNASLPAYGSNSAVAATAGGTYFNGTMTITGGAAATTSAGGAGGVGDIATGGAGSAYTGGSDACACGRPGGGGGSGYFGGGAGGARGGGGGGGSSYVAGMTISAASLVTTSSGSGCVTIFYSLVPPAPSAPASASATSGDATATITWPAASGATGYTVTSTPAGANCAVSGTSATCTGLTNGTAYTFSVVATNAGGSSAAVVTSAVTPQVPAPGSPGTPTVVAGNGQATITPSAPSSGGTPTSYTVISSPGGLTCTVVAPATSCTILGLTNGVAYTFTTQASNPGGVSLASVASAAATPLSPDPNPAPKAGGITCADSVCVVSGTLLSMVNGVTVNGAAVSITQKTDSSITFTVPALPVGRYEIALLSDSTKFVWSNGYQVKPAPIDTQVPAVSTSSDIAGFVGDSANLTASIKSAIKTAIQGAKAIECVGATAGTKATAADRALSLKRAQAACTYALKLNPALSTKLSTLPAVGIGASARRVTVKVTG